LMGHGMETSIPAPDSRRFTTWDMNITASIGHWFL